MMSRIVSFSVSAVCQRSCQRVLTHCRKYGFCVLPSKQNRQTTAFKRGHHHIKRFLHSSQSPPIPQRLIGWWLLGCCGLISGSVIIGGVTRLTESGLSMTQWHIIKGMKPPATQQEWEEEFNRYKQFPEYQHVHKDLSLEGFKKLFYLEYTHRMWGRLVGLAIIVPAVGFWAGGRLGPALKARAGMYIGLVICQGLLGWWMVKSGLKVKEGQSDVPRVSQYRLSAHLGLALLLYSSMLYTALGLLIPPTIASPSKGLTRLRQFAHGSTALVFLTALSGVFVAGLDAGLVYNSFPKMGGKWIPDDILSHSPKIKNITENPTMTQFNHRVLGTTTMAFLLGTFALAQGVALPKRAKLAANCLAGMAVIQVGLGICTLLWYVPTPLAASHQSGSVALLSMALWLMSELRKKVPRL